jgi:glycosyltransferase involved in cell wall biosynthesis
MESVLAETLENFEVSCVDVASTDASLGLLEEFAKADARVRVLQQAHEGAGAARNRGMREASGTYLLFLDADDCFEPEMFEALVAEAERNGSDIVLCRTSTFSDKEPHPVPLVNSVKGLEPGRLYAPDDLQDRAFHYCVGWPWDKLFRRDFVSGSGLEFQPLASSNDAYFVYMALLLAGSLSFLDRYLVLHRVGNPNSIENRRDLTWQNPFLVIDAMEQRLREEGLYPRYEGAFLGWAFDFCFWNFETLTGASQEAFLDMMRTKLLPRLESIGCDRLVCDYETEYLVMLRMSHAELLQEHVGAYWRQHDLMGEAEALRSRVADLEGEVESYEHSTSYRVGRAVTSVPRALKERVSALSSSKMLASDTQVSA